MIKNQDKINEEINKKISNIQSWLQEIDNKKVELTSLNDRIEKSHSKLINQMLIIGGIFASFIIFALTTLISIIGFDKIPFYGFIIASVSFLVFGLIMIGTFSLIKYKPADLELISYRQEAKRQKKIKKIDKKYRMPK